MQFLPQVPVHCTEEEIVDGPTLQSEDQIVNIVQTMLDCRKDQIVNVFPFHRTTKTSWIWW